ncbi:hypothetical protein ACF07Y_45170 [Streptomyces sp. NPDC016566]|uniref:hypothetical protein n=1 Tax=Streptomyces sp. NPDC016566 TaxID=3364967 RepID=UPI0036FEB4D4
MAVPSLSLPIDIPWERICVSEDMIDPAVGDGDRPAKWQSSIAVFKYVPDEEYQVYPGRKITYLKVTCTITGYQPKADEVQGILTNWSRLSYAGEPFKQDELERRLLSYKPCHEAILQVSVAPEQTDGVPLDEYPYFMDFQPKKRELYESVTDTKELMSRSLESLNISKSSGTTQSQEVLDIDQGFSVGASGQYAGTGGSFQYSHQGQWGTKHLGGGQSGTARTTDETHERRETTSHTTQLTQLHHLLDTYHQGTNRAVFYIQPRPHTVAPPSGFVRGPREVEGVQEFFLIVNQAVEQEDFCLDVRLDTGHLFQQKIMDYEYLVDTASFSFTNPTPVKEDTDLTAAGDTSRVLRDISNDLYNYTATLPYHCFTRSRPGSLTYTSPFPEYVIDVGNLGANPANTNGYQVLPSTQVAGTASYALNTTADGEALTISVDASSRACFKGGFDEIAVSSTVTVSEAVLIGIAASTIFGNPLGPIAAAIIASGAPIIATFEAAETAIAFGSAADTVDGQFGSAQVDVEVFLRSREKTKDTGRIEQTFFITTRRLYCCADPDEPAVHDGIVYVGRLSEYAGPLAEADPLPPGEGPVAGAMSIEQSNRLQGALRAEMLRSLASPRRTEPRPLAQSPLLLDMVLPHVRRNPLSRVLLSQPSSDVVPEELLAPLARVFHRPMEEVSRAQLLAVDTAALAAVAGVGESAIHQLKANLLGQPFRSLVEEGRARAADEAPADTESAAQAEPPEDTEPPAQAEPPAETDHDG